MPVGADNTLGSAPCNAPTEGNYTDQNKLWNLQHFFFSLRFEWNFRYSKTHILQECKMHKRNLEKIDFETESHVTTNRMQFRHLVPDFARHWYRTDLLILLDLEMLEQAGQQNGTSNTCLRKARGATKCIELDCLRHDWPLCWGSSCNQFLEVDQFASEKLV